MVFHILLPSLYGIEVDLAGFLEIFWGVWSGFCQFNFVRRASFGGLGFSDFFGFFGWLVFVCFVL